MLGSKSNGKIIGILVMVCILVMGVFSIGSFAAEGTYATLTGSYYRNTDGNYYASSRVTSKSSIDRYYNTSVRNSSDTVLVSAGGKLGTGSYLSTGYVNVYSQTGVYAHCCVYKSGAPESGILTYMTEPIR